MRKAIIPGFVLLGLWLLMSGHFDPLLLTLGVVSSAGVALLGVRFGFFERQGAPIVFSLRLLAFYLPWLALEIIKSTLDVTRCVWRLQMGISPVVFTVPASQRTSLGLAVHANSITLTPGTLSIDTEVDTIEVHALTREMAAGLLDGSMDRRVRALEVPPK